MYNTLKMKGDLLALWMIISLRNLYTLVKHYMSEVVLCHANDELYGHVSSFAKFDVTVSITVYMYLKV